MTTEEQIAECDSAIQSMTLVRDSLAATPPSDVIYVKAGASIQAAVDGAPDGATIAIEPATYDEALILSRPVMLMPTTSMRHRRATGDASVWITSLGEATILVQGNGITLAGLGIRNREASYDAVDITGSRVLVDRCTVRGDPAHGMRRGVLTHGATTKIFGCYVDDVFNVGRDSCCIGGWESGSEAPARLRELLRRAPAPANVLLDDRYLRGGAATIMYGGADTTDASKIPHHITITNSTLTKNPAWYAQGVQIKNAFELKCAEHVYMADCVLEYAGVSEGQAAYLIVLTVRNQDGGATWSCITDVVIERCLCRYGGGGVSFLGHDDVYASGPLSDVTLRNVKFTDLAVDGIWAQPPYYGAGRCVMFNNNPQHVTMDGITMEGTNMSALGYFANEPEQPTNLILQNWKYCATEYGWKIDSGGMDIPPASANLQTLMPDLIYQVTANDAGAVDYPQV